MAGTAGTVDQGSATRLIGPTVGEGVADKALIAFVIAIECADGLPRRSVPVDVRRRGCGFDGARRASRWLACSRGWASPSTVCFSPPYSLVIGLAVNDTIVVFDRIRERTRGTDGDLRATVNAAILQTLPRTLNTGLGALFILATLAVVGGDSLTNFAVALLLGLLIGIYSTVFTAAPLAVWAEEHWPIGLDQTLADSRPVRRCACCWEGERAGLASGRMLRFWTWGCPLQPAAAAAVAPGMSMRATSGSRASRSASWPTRLRMRRSRPSH